MRSKRNTVEIGREPMVTQVTRVIRNAIMNGEYGLGERLIESAIAERYRISRHVVREALQAVEGEGLVVSDAFRGRSVINPSPKEIEGLFLIRVSLESTAAALAAYKVTPEQGRRLMQEARLLSEEPKEYSQLVEWDNAIHRTIWQIADEPNLANYLEKLIWPTLKAGVILEVAPEDQKSLVEMQIKREQADDPGGHGRLLRTICQQNSGAAREAMVSHLIASGNRPYSKETSAAITAAFLAK
ncbi:MAG: GntR family transcriptional regulator [Acidobacteria bacterium]|nr:GntR family transcriptional regulator [Acidobacteriota bacterium]MCI0722380.1 GntR family transcriptional regulator [Acidobacteriota bacterium]